MSGWCFGFDCTFAVFDWFGGYVFAWLEVVLVSVGCWRWFGWVLVVCGLVRCRFLVIAGYRGFWRFGPVSCGVDFASGLGFWFGRFGVFGVIWLVVATWGFRGDLEFGAGYLPPVWGWYNIDSYLGWRGGGLAVRVFLWCGFWFWVGWWLFLGGGWCELV